MNYIISQIFIIINYLICIINYQQKKRKTILILNIISTIATAISYMFLGAYSGLAMTIIAAMRNIMFLINEKMKKSQKREILTLAIIYIATIYLASLTYTGIFSMMTVAATVIYTYSVWQKNTKIYKFLGIPVGIAAIIYNIYMLSIFGIIFETLITISAILGYAKDNKKIKKETNLNNTLTLQVQN